MGCLFYGAVIGVLTAVVTTSKLPLFLNTHHYAGVTSPNTTINPCDNFYEYCCSPWITKAEKPTFEPIWNPWIVVSEEIRRRLRKILTSSDSALTIPKLFYQSCLKITTQEDKYLKDLISLVEDLGGWPLTKSKWDASQYNWLNHLSLITRNLGIHPILKLHVDLDYKNPNQYVLYVEPGNLIYPQYILVNSDYNVELKAYERWIFESVKHLYPNRINDVCNDAIAAIVKFEILLAGLADKNNWKNERLTVGALLKISNDFSEPLGIILKNVAKFNLNTTVVIKNYTYLKNVLLLIKRTGTRVVADYLIWAVVKDLSRDTTTHMRKLNFLIDQAILGVQDDLTREHECTNKIIEYFSPALVPQYLSLYPKAKVFDMVTTMVASIKSEFIKTLTKSDWVSDKAKILSINKVKNIKLHLGFPPWILNGESQKVHYSKIAVTSDHFVNILTLKKIRLMENLSRLGKAITVALWPSSPFDVNAYYSILQNSIFIPLGLLEPPFFDPQRSKISNYGALGALIGHELSHSLDPSGIMADSTGKITKWWPDEDFAKYKTRMQCFKDNHMTGENIADSGGLKISLAASKRHDFPASTNALFFISYAQMWCEISGNSDIFTGDEHAPVSERVQSLRNIQDFRNTFQCDFGDFCEIW